MPDVQRVYKSQNITTIVVGDHNYGEGSSREHAAMEPRHLGIKVVIVKSFARIHETNLKKQGMLALTFDNENAYDKLQEDDVFNFTDLKSRLDQQDKLKLSEQVKSLSKTISELPDNNKITSNLNKVRRELKKKKVKMAKVYKLFDKSYSEYSKKLNSLMEDWKN